MGDAETKNRSGSRLARPLANVALLCISTLLVVVVGEGLFRYRFGPLGYRPRPEVLAIQEYLVTQPEYGFAWRPNVSADDGVVFDVADVVYEPLSTDAEGFINHPDAIGMQAVDVIGLGDSFVEHAAHIWFELLRDSDLSYRNLAMHRTAPPQYARVFEKHGVDLGPTWVIVGLFENDFAEASDFDNWSQSGLDWFTFHSGTWCGPPTDRSLAGRLRDGVVPGWTAALKNTRAHLRGESMSIAGPNEFERALVLNSTIHIIETAAELDARTLVLLIPSKPTATGALTREALAFDAIVDQLRTEVDAFDVIDLRAAFRAHDSPASLYYEVDGHWNAAGMLFAGEQVLAHIQDSEKEDPP